MQVNWVAASCTCMPTCRSANHQFLHATACTSRSACRHASGQLHACTCTIPLNAISTAQQTIVHACLHVYLLACMYLACTRPVHTCTCLCALVCTHTHLHTLHTPFHFLTISVSCPNHYRNKLGSGAQRVALTLSLPSGNPS